MEFAFLSLALAALPTSQSEGHLNDYFDLARLYTDVLPERFSLLGDVDGDGLPDLISHEEYVFSPAWTQVTLWRNTGDRDFEATWSRSLSATAYQVGEIGSALGDFTGDGRTDLMASAAIPPATGGPSEGIVVYPGAPGGAFGDPVLHLLPDDHFVQRIVPADFDGDGVIDVALHYLDAQGDGFVAFARVEGDALAVVQPYALDGNLLELRAEDMTGDGLPDLVFLKANGIVVRILENQSGDLSLWDELLLPVEGSFPTDNRVLLGDLEGDGDVDVVFPVLGGVNRYVVFENSPAGFASPFTDFESWDLSFSHAKLVDWDGDGDLDWLGLGVLPVGPNELRVAENNGEHFFGGPGRLRFGKRQPIDSLCDDVDGDGFMDFVGPTSVVFGRGETYLADPIVSKLPTFEASSNLPPWDVDFDGDLDFVGLGSFGPNPVVAQLNDGSGAFDLFDEPQSVFGLDPDAGAPYLGLLSRGDFDGDETIETLVYGRVPVVEGVSAKGDLVYLEATPGGSWVETGVAGPASLNIQQDPFKTWLNGDLDGDGDLDLIVDAGIYENLDGKGGLGPFQYIPELDNAVDVLDWNGDGLPDVIVEDSQELVVRLNLGSLEFSDTPLLQGTEFFGIQALDYDGDGDLDRLAYGDDQVQIQVLLNEAAGFALGPQLVDEPYATSFSGHAVGEAALTDLDNDGNLDLLVTRARYVPNLSVPLFLVSWVAETEVGTLEPKASWTTYEVWESYGPMELADLDGDGDLEIFRTHLIPGNTWQGSAGGTAQQYGQGTAGTGGETPILGAQGPYHKDSTTLTKRLRRGLGGGIALYAISLAEAEIPGYPTLSTTAYVDPLSLIALFTIPLEGAPGAPGAGAFDYPVSVQPYLPGLALWEQVFIVDPGAPEMLSASNALFIQFGE